MIQISIVLLVCFILSYLWFKYCVSKKTTTDTKQQFEKFVKDHNQLTINNILGNS